MQTLRPLGLDLVADLIHQQIGHVFHDDVLQGEARFSRLQQRAPLQAAQRLHKLARRSGLNKIGAQCGRTHRFAFYRQPDQQLALQCREPCKLLIQHRANVIENGRGLGQETADVADE